jgi:hypothetical protein
VTLQGVAQMAGWPTTTTSDAAGSRRHGYMNDGRERTAERQAKQELTGHAGTTLWDAALLSGWSYPAARDYRTPNLTSFAERGGGAKGEQLSNQVIHLGPGLTGSSAEIARGARLNPAHCRWLMRLPREWDDCMVTAMPSTPKRRRNS